MKLHYFDLLKNDPVKRFTGFWLLTLAGFFVGRTLGIYHGNEEFHWKNEIKYIVFLAVVYIVGLTIILYAKRNYKIVD